MSDLPDHKTLSNVLESEIIKVLKTLYDPEIPVNIYDLGLIYKLGVDDTATVQISMTLTSPSCPVADKLPKEVESKVRSVHGVGEVRVDLVWDPPWTKDMITPSSRLQLNLDVEPSSRRDTKLYKLRRHGMR